MISLSNEQRCRLFLAALEILKPESESSPSHAWCEAIISEYPENILQLSAKVDAAIYPYTFNGKYVRVCAEELRAVFGSYETNLALKIAGIRSHAGCWTNAPETTLCPENLPTVKLSPDLLDAR